VVAIALRSRLLDSSVLVCQVKARCRKGIPNSLRGWAWRCLCGADQLEVNAPPGRFNQLVAEAEHPVNATGPMAEYLEIIERDLDRTFPHNDRFSVKGGEAQEELRKVLRALTMANKEVGYCQVRSTATPTRTERARQTP
jgi:hypothetical protein